MKRIAIKIIATRTMATMTRSGPPKLKEKAIIFCLEVKRKRRRAHFHTTGSVVP
jgi:hypothetical protein